MNRNLSIIAALAIAASVSGCDDTRVITTPSPTPSTSPAEPGTGGPCGDGTILQPGSHCP